MTAAQKIPGSRPFFILLGGLLWLACQQTCLAEARLKGFVVVDKEHGPPAPNVAFSVDNQQRVTSSDGSLNVHFPQRKPGDTVRLTMTSPQWAVVNDYALNHTLATNADAQPVEILVAKPDERDGMALNYYRLKGNQVVDKELQLKLTKLAKLEGKTSAMEAERQRLLQERDTALKQVNELAQQLASRRPGEGSDTYNQAVNLFLAGQIDQALALLNETDLKQKGAQAQTQLKEAVDSLLLRAQLLVVKFDVAGAARVYEEVTKLAPQDAKVWFKFAYFHASQNHFEEARKGYERALGLFRLDNNQAQIAATLNNLGVLHSTENRNTEARAAYEETLGIYRTLADKNRDAYLPDVAATLNNLGILYGAENRTTDALTAYEETLKIYRTLADRNSDIYLPDVATTLNNLGNLHYQENRKAEARAAYEESLGIRRTLSEKNQEVYLPAVALILNNLGILYNDENRKAQARAALEEALNIRRSLASKNPDAYLPRLANTLNNLGELHQDENRMVEALIAYEEALRIRRTLANNNPDAYLLDVAETQNNLGILHYQENRKAKAREAYKEALDIYQRFSQKSDIFSTKVKSIRQNLNLLEKP